MVQIKKIVKYGTRIISTILSVNGLYIAALIGTQAISDYNSPRIRSPSHLEQILEREKNRAGVDNSKQINVRISYNEHAVSKSRKVSEGNYEIVICFNDAYLSTLRHELYHIADGHFDRDEDGIMRLHDLLIYLYWHEPQATIYAATGLKP